MHRLRGSSILSFLFAVVAIAVPARATGYNQLMAVVLKTLLDVVAIGGDGAQIYTTSSLMESIQNVDATTCDSICAKRVAAISAQTGTLDHLSRSAASANAFAFASEVAAFTMSALDHTPDKVKTMKTTSFLASTYVLSSIGLMLNMASTGLAGNLAGAYAKDTPPDVHDQTISTLLTGLLPLATNLVIAGMSVYFLIDSMQNQPKYAHQS